MGDSPAWSAAIATLQHHRTRAGVFVDFDGTLAPIVDEPAAARPAHGIVDVLARLAERFAVVAVISGRPAEFLQLHLPPVLTLSGLYGLETVARGVHRADRRGEQWRPTVAAAIAAANTAGPDGMRVEPKGMTVALHYRADPSLEHAVRAFATELAARTGLVVSEARMAVELRPPVEVDKGTAVADLAHDLDAIVFVGDDFADVDAFDALDELAARGALTIKVAVRSDESPAELIERADFVVDGPVGVFEFLVALAAENAS